MKKKLLIVLGSLVAILGIVYLSGYFDGGKPTAADKKAGEDISNDEEMNRAIDNAEMPTVVVDSAAKEMKVNEDYDPESML